MRDIKVAVWDSVGIGFSVGLFGALFAAAAIAEGVSFSETLILSALVFAGTAQFTALAVWGDAMPLMTVVISAFLVSSRHVFMGIVVGHEFRKQTFLRRYCGLFVLCDMGYVLGVKADHVESKFVYIVAVGVVVYTFWLLETFAGLLLTQFVQTAVIESLAYAGIMFFGLLVVLLVKSNKGFVSPIIVASMATLTLYYFNMGQAVIMLGAVIAGGVANLYLEFKERRGG